MHPSRHFPSLLAALLLGTPLILVPPLHGQTPGRSGSTSDQPPFPTERDSPSAGQATPAAALGNAPLTVERLQQRRQAAEAADLPADVKQQVLDRYAQAINALNHAKTLEEQANRFAQMAKTAPDQLETLRKQLAEISPGEVAVQDEASSLTLDQLEQRLRTEEAELAGARTRLNDIEQTLKELRDRPDQLRDRIANTKAELAALETEEESPAPADQPAALAQAQMAQRRARRQELRAELHAYKQELQAHPTRVDLLAVKRDIAAKQVAREEAEVKAWREATLDRRQQVAQAARREAEKVRERVQEQAIELPEAVSRLADENVALSEELGRAVRKQNQLVSERDEVASRLEELKADATRARNRLDAAGLTEGVGQLLRTQRKALPDLRSYRNALAKHQSELTDVTAREVDVEERRRGLVSVEARAEEILAPIQDPDRRQTLSPVIRKLLEGRRDLLAQLRSQYKTYAKTLGDLVQKEEELIETTRSFQAFIDEHILWTRSMEPLSLADFRPGWARLAWFAKPGNWGELGTVWVGSLTSHFGLWALALLVGGGLVAAGRAWKPQLAEIAPRIWRVQSDSIVLSLRALLITGILAAGWPLLLGFIGWRFSLASEPFPHAIGNGLLAVAALLPLGLFLRSFSDAYGLAGTHFRWPASTRLALRRGAGWLLVAALPLTFLLAVVESVPEVISPAIGRHLFIAIMVLVAVICSRVLRPNGGVLAMVGARKPEGWGIKLRHLWGPGVATVAGGLVILSALGYDYTAVELARQLAATAALVLGAVVVYELLLRWLQVAHRRMALADAKRRREVGRRSREQEAPSAGTELASADEPEVGLETISDQTRKLIHTGLGVAMFFGLWGVWAQAMPALNVLNDVELWTVSVGEATVPITLASLLIALLVGVLTGVGARNIPGLLEMALASRLSLETGSRHAITTICRYVIVAVGIIVFFNVLGVKWSKVQWLVAALGVGLGFGLQEIVANFVSGLILLFERPIRVGDTVTVGDTLGTVTRMQIRATTVTDWDMRELLIPNKEFITSRFSNWSLSDQTIRLVYRVGVAYGSDVGATERVLQQIGDELPTSLDNPPPNVVFRGFGDSALEFELRVYVKGYNSWLATTHTVHRTIDEEFKEAGITIAYPQRDVHMDTGRPLDVRVLPEGSDEGSTTFRASPRK